MNQPTNQGTSGHVLDEYEQTRLDAYDVDKKCITHDRCRLLNVSISLPQRHAKLCY